MTRSSGVCGSHRRLCPCAVEAENNLYWLALKTSIFQMEKDWGHSDDSLRGKQIRTDYRHMIVEKDPLITDGLPAEFDNHSVEYLDHEGLVARYGKLREEYAVLVIHPIQNEGPTLKVAVVVYWVSYKKRRLMLALSDWSDVEFRYDCDQQQFVMSSVKLGGI
ncbi:MAG TPA: hypothetical protein VKV39_17655 [Candidatus Sulfotelmatobacter sp.]|nr:hypothetical protein [Candidatus Sulfotelmatobacter sp.]